MTYGDMDGLINDILAYKRGLHDYEKKARRAECQSSVNESPSEVTDVALQEISDLTDLVERLARHVKRHHQHL